MACLWNMVDHQCDHLHQSTIENVDRIKGKMANNGNLELMLRNTIQHFRCSQSPIASLIADSNIEICTSLSVQCWIILFSITEIFWNNTGCAITSLTVVYSPTSCTQVFYGKVYHVRIGVETRKV